MGAFCLFSFPAFIIHEHPISFVFSFVKESLFRLFQKIVLLVKTRLFLSLRLKKYRFLISYPSLIFCLNDPIGKKISFYASNSFNIFRVAHFAGICSCRTENLECLIITIFQKSQENVFIPITV